MEGGTVMAKMKVAKKEPTGGVAGQPGQPGRLVPEAERQRMGAAAGEWMQRSGVKLGQRISRTGEMAAPGTFECIACGERTELQTPAHLPACGHCQKMEVRRG